jgi:hypothetical protein
MGFILSSINQKSWKRGSHDSIVIISVLAFLAICGRSGIIEFILSPL